MIGREIEAGAFADMLPEGCKIIQSPSLPKEQFKKGRRKYEISDIRLLHPLGIEALAYILDAIRQDASTTEVRIKSELDKNEEDIVRSIVMGISYSAKERGNYIGGCICYQTTVEEVGDIGNDRILVFSLDGMLTKRLHKALMNNEKEISYVDMMIAVCDDMLDNPVKIQEV